MSKNYYNGNFGKTGKMTAKFEKFHKILKSNEKGFTKKKMKIKEKTGLCPKKSDGKFGKQRKNDS